MSNAKQTKGLSLIELLCVLFIVAIIASVAYPSYSKNMMKVSRQEAKSGLLALQNQYERYFIHHNSYKHAQIGEGKHALISEAITKRGHYKLEITTQKDRYYLLTAHPNSERTKRDETCGSFTLNSLGEPGITGTGPLEHCWNH